MQSEYELCACKKKHKTSQEDSRHVLDIPSGLMTTLRVYSVRVCVHVCMCVCVYIYIYIYI
jgi:hypothetical protein